MEKLILEQLRKKGYQVSRQRQIIVRELCKCKVIEDVDKFWIEMRMKNNVSYAAVYSNIRILMQNGYLRREHRNHKNCMCLISPTEIYDIL